MSFFFGGDPFGGRPESNFPGGRGGGSKKNVDTNGLYELLGVAKDASPEEIKRAYKKLAVKHHPDKGGDEARFKEITEAAEILLDEDKRKVYDEHGKEGIDAGMGEGHGAHDLFSSMFGGGGGQQQQKQQIAPIQRKMQVTLDDLYNGANKEVDVTRKRTCDKCSGTGASKPNAETTCEDCRGRGIKVVVRQVAPGFVQQFQAKCEKCEGEGKFIPKKFQCTQCEGEKLSTDNKTLTVEILKGMSHGEKVVFRGEGHKIPELPAGDVEVILVMHPHDKFQRKENDLKHNMKISLAEALDVNRKLAVTHLDGRTVVITRPVGHILTPGSVMVVRGEGMPKRENATQKGDLYIEFTVNFPTTLPKDAMDTIVSTLTPHVPNEIVVPDVVGDEEHWEGTLEEVGDHSEYGRKSRRTREAYHDEDGDDDEEGGGQGPVQCQQM